MEINQPASCQFGIYILLDGLSRPYKLHLFIILRYQKDYCGMAGAN